MREFEIIFFGKREEAKSVRFLQNINRLSFREWEKAAR